MRLICPNCGAQYEVPDEVIPTGGRDVQCSNCGDTWFQNHLKSGAPSDDDEQDAPREWEKPETAPARSEPSAKEDPTPEEPVTAADERDQEESDQFEPDQDAPDEDEPSAESEEAAEATPPPPTRRSVDPGVADILRQEAAHEQQVRASESAGGLETQPDLGLTEPPIAPDERSQQARARMERLRGEAPAPDGVTSDETDDHPDIDPSSRRNLLPDIEEINSSLTSVNDHDEPTAAPMPEDLPLPRRRSGFRTGFRLSLLLFVLGTLAYVFAPQIAAMLPAAEAPLDGFVTAVNGLRLGLNDLIGSVTGWLSDMGSPASGG